METSQPISDLNELLGKTVLIGITRVDHNDELVGQDQFHGRVESLNDGLVHIRVAGSGEDFTLPPETSAFTRAQPGHYRLRATAEVVVDPDFTSSWTVRAPAPGEHSQDGGRHDTEQDSAGKPPGSLLSSMTHPNSNPHLAFHALPHPEAASA